MAKNQKTLNVGKIRKYYEERVFFEKKTFSFFLKPSLQKWEGAKYAAGSWPSYFLSSQIVPIESVVTCTRQYFSIVCHWKNWYLTFILLKPNQYNMLFELSIETYSADANLKR